MITYEPPGLLVMRADRPFPMDITYRLEPVSDGTRVQIRLAGGGSGFFRLAGPLLGAAVRRNLQRDLRRLRERLNATAGASAHRE